MLERVLKAISRYSMLPLGTRVIAAVSGGPDSVCLLGILKELAPELGFTISGVAHFNHKLRGAESDEDERYVASLAATSGLPFFRSEPPPGALPGNLEQNARRLRREFFTSLIGSGESERVALGHTRDDQAETVLFRILRGSGLAGLAGIHPVTAGLVRPLIDVTRKDVEDFLRSRNIPWREDSTNRDARFSRNRIRHGLLPQLAQEWNPNIGATLAHLADLAFEEERWWSAALDTAEFVPSNLLVASTHGIELNARILANLPRGVARRAVRRAIASAKGDLRRIEFQHVEQVLELAAGKFGYGHACLPGIEITRSFDWIRVAAGEQNVTIPRTPVQIPGTFTSPDGESQIRLEKLDHREVFDEQNQEPACANLRVELSWGRIPACLELRGWRPGDHYCPVGQSHDQNLREMFQKARVPSWRRKFWPILSSGTKILWARRFGAAAEYASSEPGPVLRISEANSLG